jgi:predicted hydrocarbon binding protein
MLYASTQQALRLYYGRGARGILLRIGEGMWARMMAQANLFEKAQLEIVRRLPVPARRRRMLELLADVLREAGGAVSVHTLDLDLLLVDHSAAATLNQTSPEPICFVTLGLIQAALFWATGQEADMEEIACKAAGAPACEFKIKLGGK